MCWRLTIHTRISRQSRPYLLPQTPGDYYRDSLPMVPRTSQWSDYSRSPWSPSRPSHLKGKRKTNLRLRKDERKRKNVETSTFRRTFDLLTVVKIYQERRGPKKTSEVRVEFPRLWVVTGPGFVTGKRLSSVTDRHRSSPTFVRFLGLWIVSCTETLKEEGSRNRVNLRRSPLCQSSNVCESTLGVW